MAYKILFQGDSITDCNRRLVNHGLGDGFVYLISKELSDHEVINKGISGNRVSDLKKRWKKDALDIKPDILTIFIGINDVWHKHAFGKRFSIDKFEENYKYLITSMKEMNPNIKIILMTPFYLPFGAYLKAWDKEFDLIMNLTHKLALIYGIPLVNLHEAFKLANYKTKDTDLLYDGVHPTPLGHELIKKEWLKVYLNHIKP